MVEGKGLKEKLGKFVRAFEPSKLPQSPQRGPIRLPKSRPRMSREKSRRAGRAVTGILGALVPQEALAGTVTYGKKGAKGDRGRGRPHGTFKARYVPGIGTVRVPTHLYRKMMSAAKSKRRLAEAQRQAQFTQQLEAEQLAAVQRQSYEQPDGFLESPDMDHEARVARTREQELYQQQVEQQQQPSRFQQGVRTFGQNAVGLVNQIRQRKFQMQQRIAQRQQAGQQDLPEFAQQAGQQVGQQSLNIPQTSILSNTTSVLNAPNVFNNPRGNKINNW